MTLTLAGSAAEDKDNVIANEEDMLERSAKCSSGFVGVHRNISCIKKPWQAITARKIYIGSYATAVLAARARRDTLLVAEKAKNMRKKSRKWVDKKAAAV